MPGATPTDRTRAAIAAAIVAAAWAPAGCSTFIGTTSASFLKVVQESRDPNLRFVAYGKLGSTNCYDGPADKAHAVEVLANILQKGKEPVASRAVICRTLGEVGSAGARPALIKATGDHDGIVRAEACRALGKVGTQEDATLLAKVMTVDTIEDCRIAAIEGLGSLKPDDVRIHTMLVQGMEHEDPAIRFSSLQALRKIFGKDLGTDPAAWRDLVEGGPSKDKGKGKGKAKPDPKPAEAKGDARPEPAPAGASRDPSQAVAR